MHVLAFIVFLIAFFVWSGASAKLLEKVKRDTLVNKTFAVSELALLVSLGGIIAFIFLLTGYFDWGFAIALIAFTQLGIVLAAILNGFLVSRSSHWGARTLWAGGEFGLQNKWLMLMLLGLTLLATLAYPIAVGWVYFTLSAPDVTARVFRYTFVWIFLSGFPLMLFVLIGALVSDNLDEETRSRFLVTQLTGLVPNALWLAILFASFGMSRGGYTLDIGPTPITFSPLLVGILVAFFLLTGAIPYLIGAQRAKAWRTFLVEERKRWMNKLDEILNTPAGLLYLPKLTALQTEIDQAANRFVDSDIMVASGIQIDSGVVPEEMKEIAPAYRIARDQDPRFKYLDWLREMSLKISEIREDLVKVTGEAELEKSAKEWVPALRPRKDELNQEATQSKKTRTPAVILYTVIIAPILGTVLNEFGKWLWATASQTLPH